MRGAVLGAISRRLGRACLPCHRKGRCPGHANAGGAAAQAPGVQLPPQPYGQDPDGGSVGADGRDVRSEQHDPLLGRDVPTLGTPVKITICMISPLSAMRVPSELLALACPGARALVATRLLRSKEMLCCSLQPRRPTAERGRGVSLGHNSLWGVQDDWPPWSEDRMVGNTQ